MYSSAKIAERIKEEAKSQEIQLKDILSSCDLNKNTLLTMTRGSFPKADSLAKIADYLGCSVDSLLGRDIKREKSPGMEDSMPRDEQERELIRLARQAAPAQKAVALQVLKLAVENERSASRKS